MLDRQKQQLSQHSLSGTYGERVTRPSSANSCSHCFRPRYVPRFTRIRREPSLLCPVAAVSGYLLSPTCPCATSLPLLSGHLIYLLPRSPHRAPSSEALPISQLPRLPTLVPARLCPETPEPRFPTTVRPPRSPRRAQKGLLLVALGSPFPSPSWWAGPTQAKAGCYVGRGRAATWRDEEKAGDQLRSRVNTRNTPEHSSVPFNAFGHCVVSNGCTFIQSANTCAQPTLCR